MLSVWKLYSVDDKMINECETFVGMRLGRGNPPQCRFLRHKSHMGRRRGTTASNRLSYGTAARFITVD
jgi:hypothetical protein